MQELFKDTKSGPPEPPPEYISLFPVGEDSNHQTPMFNWGAQDETLQKREENGNEDEQYLKSLLQRREESGYECVLSERDRNLLVEYYTEQNEREEGERQKKLCICGHTTPFCMWLSSIIVILVFIIVILAIIGVI